MPELHAIETQANFTPAAGNVVVFLATENNKLVLKAKKSDGTVVTLSGGENIVLGQVDENHRFQPLSFSGSTATASGSPETVNTFYTWNGVLASPLDMSVNELREALETL